MNTRRIVPSLLGVLVLLAVAGCAAPAGPAGSAGKAGAKRVAVVTPYMANETTKYSIDKFKAGAEAKGWQVTVTDTAGDFNLLVTRIQDAVNQKVDAIVLGMGDPAQMTTGLQAAQKANIPVFGLDAGVAPGVALNVTSDNTALGKVSADALAKAIGSKGKVVMFTHDPHPGVRERGASAEQTFKGVAGIQIAEKKHVDVPGPVENARKITEDLLAAYPKDTLAGIWAGWDEPALGATQALQAAGRTEVKVVGIDGTKFAQAEIAKGGPFVATVAQDFDGMASKLTSLIDDYFNGKKPADQLYKIPGKLITKDNAGK